METQAPSERGLTHSPAPVELEAEVVRLREQCRQLASELTKRFDEVAQIPRRLLQTKRRVFAFVRAHPLVTLGALALVVATLVGRRAR